MGTGILICGLNGAGKSTLGKALAEKLRFHYIDNENLYFPKTDPHYLYASPRTREEAEALLLREIKSHENFILSAVKGDYGEAFHLFLQYIVWLRVPRDIRIQRVKARSFQKFGARMLPGGDLYQQEAQFFHMAQSRPERFVEEWVTSLDRPVLQIDGTRSVEENTNLIIQNIQKRTNG